MLNKKFNKSLKKNSIKPKLRRTKKQYKHLKGGTKNPKETLLSDLIDLLSFFPDTSFSFQTYAEQIIENINSDEIKALSLQSFKQYTSMAVKNGFSSALKFINPIDPVENPLEYFQKFDNIESGFQKSKVIYCNTHSSLPHPEEPDPYVLVPPNITVCFLNPIQHFGISRETKLFEGFPAEKLENRKQLFQQLFECGQKTVDQVFRYNSEYPKTSVKGISHLKFGSWYYPGQLAPNVVFSFDKSEMLEEKEMGITRVTYPRAIEGADATSSNSFGIELDEHCTSQVKIKDSYLGFLYQLFLKFQNPNFRYVILINGCRSLPSFDYKNGKKVDTQFYQKMMQREIYYTLLNKKEPIFRQLAGEESNLSHHLPLNYYSSVVEYYTTTKFDGKFDYSMENKLYSNFKNLHVLSRFTPVYQEIYQYIQSRLLTDEEIKFIQTNSSSKLLLFLLRLFREIPEIEKQHFVKSNIEKLLARNQLISYALHPFFNLCNFLDYLDERIILTVPHPRISNYQIDLLISQTANIIKLSKFIQVSIPSKLFGKIYLTNYTVQKINAFTKDQDIFLEEVKSCVFENYYVFYPLHFYKLPKLTNIKIKNLIIPAISFTARFEQIKFLELDNFQLDNVINLVAFLSQFPNLEELKISFLNSDAALKFVDLSSLNTFTKLTKLELENINKISILRIKHDYLKVIHLTQMSGAVPLVFIADLTSMEEVNMKVTNLNIDGTSITGNKILNVFQYESLEGNSPGLKIWKEDNLLFKNIQITHYENLGEDLKRFRYNNLNIDGQQGPNLNQKILTGILTSNYESLDLINFTLDPEFTEFATLIPILYIISHKNIIIRDSKISALEKFLSGLRIVSNKILFFDCE